MAQSAPKKTVKPIPEGYHTLTPCLTVREGKKAIEFYKKAFGAEERGVMYENGSKGGRVMHAELKIGDSIMMLADECPEMGNKAPPTLGGSASGLYIYSPDVDMAFRRACDAGATVQMPPTDMFWGDRYARLTDPFGHSWGIATHKADPTPEEMERGRAEFMKKATAGAKG